jgi:hypothetical protein
MTFDHVPWNPLANFSYEMLGYFSCAEIFVFLSGLVAGWVYGRVAERDGVITATKRVLRRAGLVYGAYSLYCVLSLVSRLRSGDDGSWRQFAERMLLWREAGILPLYIVLLVMTPLLLLALRAGHMRLLLAASAALWSVEQFPAATMLNGPESDFHRLAWQIIFVTGLCAGYRRSQALSFFPKGLARLAIPAGVACLLMLFARHAMDLEPEIRRAAFLTSLHNLGPVRLLNFALLLPLAAATPESWRVAHGPKRWTRALGVLGRNSLLVYTYGWIALSLPGAQAAFWWSAPMAVQLAAAGAFLVSLWLAVELNRLLMQRQRNETA